MLLFSALVLLATLSCARRERRSNAPFEAEDAAGCATDVSDIIFVGVRAKSVDATVLNEEATNVDDGVENGAPKKRSQ